MGVQIASRSVSACKRFVFSGLESGICWGAQPPLSAALETSRIVILRGFCIHLGLGPTQAEACAGRSQTPRPTHRSSRASQARASLQSRITL